MTAARTFVVGDIHGCADELCRLLDALAPGAGDTLIFLGDYIDRGPSPKRVVDRLLQLAVEGPSCRFLKGNHEDMFLGFLGLRGAYGDAFLFNGGHSTLRSYGLESETARHCPERLPPEHLRFLTTLHAHTTHGDFLCVHAGIDPQLPLEQQRPEDLFWIREEFILAPHPLPFTVLFGHTPQAEVLFDLPYKIGLDTGLVYWNQLSCLELEARRLHQIRRGARTVTIRDCTAEFGRRQTHAVAAPTGTSEGQL